MTWLFWYWFGMITRRMDIMVLWPSVKQAALEMEASRLRLDRLDEAGDPLDMARGAFALHCFADPGWRVLPEAEISRIVNSLR